MWSLSKQKMRAIGHRGCRGPHQENSFAAIQWAYSNGAWAVEVDLWLIQGELVLIHDRRAHAYNGATGLIKNVALEKLRKIMEIPSLDYVLRHVPPQRGINIEIKDPEALLPMIELIVDHVKAGLIRWEQMLFSSFDHRILAKLKQQHNEAQIAPLFAGIPLDICRYANQMGATSINMDVDCLDLQTVQQAHKEGLAVNVYTVNCAIDVDMLADWEVDGIICDDVAWLMAYRHA